MKWICSSKPSQSETSLKALLIDCNTAGSEAYETRFQRLECSFGAYQPRALPWAGMSDADGVRLIPEQQVRFGDVGTEAVAQEDFEREGEGDGEVV